MKRAAAKGMKGMMFSLAPLVVVPAKWHIDRERSANMATANRDVRHFGSAPSTDVIEAYYPNEIGAGMVVSRYTTSALPDGRGAAIAAVIAEFESVPSSGVTITEATKARATGDKQLEITVGGRDAGATMRYMSRMIVVADATSVAAVIGLCLERDDANLDHVAQCRAALLTLDPGIAIVDRVGIAFPGAVPNAPATPTLPEMKLRDQATLGDGAKLKLAPITVPAPTEADRRPLFIGVGIVVLAVALWWNRRNRDRFDDDNSEKDLDA